MKLIEKNKYICFRELAEVISWSNSFLIAFRVAAAAVAAAPAAPALPASAAAFCLLSNYI